MSHVSHLDSLNPEQKKAVLHKDGPLLILAGAGAGKTKVITHRILELILGGIAPEKILAVTFTNKAAKEMRERVSTLLKSERLDVQLTEHTRYFSFAEAPHVSTFHSLCVSILREFAKEAGLPRHFSIYDRADSVRAIKEGMKEAGVDPKQFEPRKILGVISRQKGDGFTLGEFRERAEDEYFLTLVLDVWEKYELILAKEKSLDFDDLLLRALTLLRSRPDIAQTLQTRWSHLHIDEYQDTNKVQYEITKILAAARKNLCVVGDLDQCLAKGTQVTMGDGSLRPVELVRAGDMVLSNYGSGDFRPARVVRMRTRRFTGELVHITTAEGKVLASTSSHVHFAGFRLGLTPQLYFTYLMEKRGVGFRLGVSQTYTNAHYPAMIGFQQRCNQEHADRVWIVGVHANQKEARLLEYELSLRYAIPTIPFVARTGGSTNGYVHDQASINRLFKMFDTRNSALQLLRDQRLSPDCPHHVAQSRNANRRNIVLTLCGDRRGKTPMHRISIVGNDKAGSEIVEALGFSVRPAKKNSASWRFETANKDYGVMLKRAAALQYAFKEAQLIETARLGRNRQKLRGSNSLPLVPAASILPGMAMFTSVGDYDVVKNVERMPVTEEKIYDMDVENTHNFLANNLLTHNCIYSWRGATLKNILHFEKDYPAAVTVLLEENYRSTKNILHASNEIIKKNELRREKNLYTKNEEGERLSLYVAYDEGDEARYVAGMAKELIAGGAAAEEIAVLYRANFQSRIIEEAMLFAEVPYQVLGVRFFERKEVKDTLSYVCAALNPESLGDIKRAINTPPRGIGKTTLLRVLAGEEEKLPEAARGKVRQFRKILADIKNYALSHKPSETIKFALAASGFEEHLKSGNDEDIERLENIHELVTLAAKYDALPVLEGVEKLLEDAALATDQDEMEEKLPAVKLMTVHASKGLEFSYVFITGLEEGLFPHEGDERESQEHEEEERRLFYVALTRAKSKVFLSYTSVRTIFGARQVNIPSEFITDIPEDVLEEGAREVPLRTIYLE